jgi:hypothetical protein
MFQQLELQTKGFPTDEAIPVMKFQIHTDRYFIVILNSHYGEMNNGRDFEGSERQLIMP